LLLLRFLGLGGFGPKIVSAGPPLILNVEPLLEQSMIVGP
jgi:hypothetical protein